MSFVYTQSDLQSGMNRRIQGKQGILIDPQETMNEAVREVLNEIRIRSTRRRASLVPNLMNGEFEYAAPSDLHSINLIDIPTNAKRSDGEFTLVPSEQFARNARDGDVAIDDYNGIRRLQVRSVVPANSQQVDPLSVAGTSDWRAFGVVSGVEATTDDAVSGNTSIEYDLSASSGTTAGIYNDSITSVDLSEFILGPAYVFCYARITSPTNLTNFKLRLGSSATNYYEFTVTARNDGTVLIAGWNLLRFDLSSPSSTVGSPNAAALTYAAIFMTKTTGKISEDGYMFNLLQASKGKYADVKYYSKYGWQSSAGIYKENSTDPSDLLVADSDEFDLFVKKARVMAGAEVDIAVGYYRGKIMNPLQNDYDAAKANYVLKNPSEDKTTISSYYDYDDDTDAVTVPDSSFL